MISCSNRVGHVVHEPQMCLIIKIIIQGVRLIDFQLIHSGPAIHRGFGADLQVIILFFVFRICLETTEKSVESPDTVNLKNFMFTLTFDMEVEFDDDQVGILYINF